MSEDLIKRSDAIKALRKLGHEVVVIDKVCSLGVATEFIDAIRDIPSADRPQGESILQDTIQRLERVIKHGVVGKDGMHPVSAEVVLNWLKGADDEH